MVEHGVSYCGMQVITQFQVGDGAAELEADADFATLFGGRRSDRHFTISPGACRAVGRRRIWTTGRAANEQRMEWMRRFRELGGVLLAGTDMQFGGIMLHRELRNLEALGMSRLEVIAAATGGCARALRMETKLGMVRDGPPGRSRRAPPRSARRPRRLAGHCVRLQGGAVWPTVNSDRSDAVDMSDRGARRSRGEWLR